MRPAFAFASVFAGFLITGAFFTTFALAHDEADGMPVILSPKDGQVVTSPVTVIVEVQDALDAMHDSTKPATKGATEQMGQMDKKDQMGQMGEMHGDDQHHGAHLHLIVDSPLPKSGTTVPMDEKHIHLMHGETKTVLKLAPGKHMLQLIMGGEDHVIRANAPLSKMITITVQ